MTQYRYDMRLGHYIAINEDQAPATAQPAAQPTTDSNAQQLTVAALPKNLEDENVAKEKTAMENELKTLNDKLEVFKKNIIEIQNKIAAAQEKGANQDELNKLLLELVKANKDQLEQEKQLFDCRYKHTNNILQLQNKIIVESAMNLSRIPEKYKYLTESNVLNAKVYVDKLIKDDNQERIKGMADFKKAFCNSKLLYGKDKEGYFAVCVDQEDFNKLTDTLEEAGYLRDAIIATVMPLLFDRSNLTK